MHKNSVITWSTKSGPLKLQSVYSQGDLFKLCITSTVLSAFKDSLICCCPWNLLIFKSCYWLLSESWRLIIIMKLKANSSAFIIWKYKPQIFNHLGSTITISHALWNTVCSFPELFQPDFANLNWTKGNRGWQSRFSLRRSVKSVVVKTYSQKTPFQGSWRHDLLHAPRKRSKFLTPPSADPK